MIKHTDVILTEGALGADGNLIREGDYVRHTSPRFGTCHSRVLKIYRREYPGPRPAHVSPGPWAELRVENTSMRIMPKEALTVEVKHLQHVVPIFMGE